MTPSASKRLAVAIGVTSLCIYAALVAAFVFLPVINPEFQRYGYWRESIIIPTYAIVGLLITTRQPTNAIGWLFTLAALAGAMQAAAGQYAVISLTSNAIRLPGGDWAAWISQLSQITTLSTIFLLLMLFPNGRLLSRRWRPVAWSLIAGIVVAILSRAFTVGQFEDYPIPNPAGIPMLTRVLEAATAIGIPLLIFGFFGTLVMLIVRTYKSRGVERQQIKWFAFTAIISIILLFSTSYLQNIFRGTMIGLLVDVVGGSIWVIGPVGLAVAATLAILRYRLFDIDVIIRRTLVYGALTLTLGLVYFGSVILLQGLFKAVSGQESAVVIVISTLVIAALFNPLRRRIQNDIDRRFYRRKYDAEKVVETFSASLREEVDLDDLQNQILAVVEDTLQPDHVSLWLKETRR